MSTETIEIPVPDGTADAYVARPDEGTHPGVLFLMDAIGLRPQIARMIERIADWGYVVLAPNLFHRDGRAEDLAPRADLRQPGEREKFFEQVMPRVQGLTGELMERDIPAYLSALRSLDGVAPGPVGVTGYCMGARLAVRAAGLDQTVGAVGGWHGGSLVTEDDDSPHTRLADARAELVFGHADNDRSMGPEAIARLGEALEAAGLVAKNEVYEGAPHGYTMADTSMYHEAAAERHFTELEALLDRRL
ncbi:MAG TPA: dienelactone hydrolase family protein [Marmoricola sp.]|nr:dienelactone hydrolase family protein [Marmoricola sp.]